jgi:hypothetical protein
VVRRAPLRGGLDTPIGVARSIADLRLILDAGVGPDGVAITKIEGYTLHNGKVWPAYRTAASFDVGDPNPKAPQETAPTLTYLTAALVLFMAQRITTVTATPLARPNRATRA